MVMFSTGYTRSDGAQLAPQSGQVYTIVAVGILLHLLSGLRGQLLGSEPCGLGDLPDLVVQAPQFLADLGDRLAALQGLQDRGLLGTTLPSGADLTLQAVLVHLGLADVVHVVVLDGGHLGDLLDAVPTGEQCTDRCSLGGLSGGQGGQDLLGLGLVHLLGLVHQDLHV